MSSRNNMRQGEPKNARPPEYIIIRRQAAAPGGQLAQPRNTRHSKKETRFDETEARREQRREERYRAKRRRQWILSLSIMVIFIVVVAIALHLLASRSTSTPAAGSQGYHMHTGFSLAHRSTSSVDSVD